MMLARLLTRLGPSDVANVRRDALLAWVPLAPILFALVIQIGWVPLDGWMNARWDLSLAPYAPLVMGFLLLLGPTMAGMVAGFLLLDERDEGVLHALQVTPVPFRSFLAYRLFLPIVLGFVLTLVAYPLAGLVPLPAWQVATCALLASASGPIMALVLVRFAEDKVAGFVVVKAMNVVNLLPVAAFFLPGPVQWAAGAVPTYWPLGAYWRYVDGAPAGIALAVGIVVNATWLGLLAWRLERSMRR